MESRFLELENIVKIQGVAIEQQRKILDQQREELHHYKTDNKVLKSKVEHLEEQLQLVLERAGDNLDINEIPTHAMQKRPGNGTFGSEDVSLSTKHIKGSMHKDIRSTKRSSIRQSESSEAFFAYITGTPCLKDHETLVFNHEVTDLGNGYNPGDGIFTVPTTGTYVFAWATASRDDYYVSALTVNGRPISHAFTDTGSQPHMSQATGIAVINVNQGDHVFIRKVFGVGCNIHDPDYHLTTFAGWRLFGY